MSTVMIGCFLSLLGFVVTIFMLGTNNGDQKLVMILCLAFFAAGCFLGILGLLLFRRADKLAGEELDLLEQEDSPHSFFVGEGTLATFEDENLRIHGRGEGKKEIVVPYFDLKFYSICTRRAPRERGNFSVVIEIPSRYFNNNAARDLPIVLIQTDGKDRLYDRLKELNLTLSGEKYTKEQSDEKFTREENFAFWHPVKVKKSTILMAIGLLVLIGGIIAMIFWKDNSAPGSIMIVLGGYCGIRGAIALFRSRAGLGIYREGIYYHDPEGINSVFLKWGEFSCIRETEKDNKKFLTCSCPYGDYDLPYFEGAYQEIIKKHPEKADGAGANGGE